MTYARTVDVRFKPGKRDQAIDIVNQVGPGVENTKGYEGMLILTPTDDSENVHFVVLWDSEETMLDSEKGVMRRVMDATRDLMDGEPEITHYMVSNKLVQKQMTSK